jgi:hypothetical protein
VNASNGAGASLTRVFVVIRFIFVHESDARRAGYGRFSAHFLASGRSISLLVLRVASLNSEWP